MENAFWPCGGGMMVIRGFILGGKSSGLGSGGIVIVIVTSSTS
jgi:hypothetical protein